MDTLTSSLATLTIHPDEPLTPTTCVPFDIPINLAYAWRAVPRYLFRIHGPTSDGTTTSTFTRPPANSRTDIFSLQPHDAAVMLNKHLWWSSDKTSKDNLTSWTSSLLVALQYAIYRAHTDRPGHEIGDMYLTVVDTTLFPNDVFVPDVLLLEAFRLEIHPNIPRGRGQPQNLNTLWDWRTGDKLVFGEHLSQGYLSLAGRSRTISLGKVFEISESSAGLRPLQPDLDYRKSAKINHVWSSKVVEMRRGFHHPIEWSESQSMMRAKEIGELFGGKWVVPMMVYFATLYPRMTTNESILQLVWFWVKENPGVDLGPLEFTDPLKEATTYLPETKNALEVLEAAGTHCFEMRRQSVKKNIEEMTRRMKEATSLVDLHLIDVAISTALQSLPINSEAT